MEMAIREFARIILIVFTLGLTTGFLVGWFVLKHLVLKEIEKLYETKITVQTVDALENKIYFNFSANS